MKKLVKAVKRFYLKKVKKMSDVQILQMESGLCMNVFQATVNGLKDINTKIDEQKEVNLQAIKYINAQNTDLDGNKAANDKVISKFEDFLA